jgi:hypothetical protein
MNGKNRRVKSSWSRGSSKKILKNSKNNLKPLYKLPFFSLDLKSSLTHTQFEVTHYFERYNFTKKIENFSYNNNTPKSIIYLRQRDFNNGTVRITVPGIYVLVENIVFNPNEDNDFMPTQEQISSGLYPENMQGPYHLGFFAAITIETDNVILDLNDHTIKQSVKHNIQQRFYANIELANSPFIPTQGPANFNGGLSYKAANNVLIMHGILGRSSHHGIHANEANKVIIYNLNITDFEVAGIALNGTTTGILHNLKINNSKRDIPVLGTYSQARFIRKFLNLAVSNHPTLTFNGKTITDILTNINNDLNATYTSYIQNGTIPDNLFKNTTKELDGNVYGIVLSVRGVVVNDFITERTSQMIGNTDIKLDGIIIDNITSTPLEIIGVNSKPTSNEAYGGKVQVGPIGDVLQIENIQDSFGRYDGNSLSDAHLILAKSEYTGPKGTTNIASRIIEWAETNVNINTVVTEGDGNYYYVAGGDSMSHIMKGNIGLFISAGDNISANNIHIKNIQTKGNNVGITSLRPITPNPPTKKALASHSLLITGSSNIKFITSNNNIKNSTSENGDNYRIRQIGTNSNISIK